MGTHLIEKYRQYASTAEAYAVLFIKKYLKASDKKWVDILDWSAPRGYDMKELEFKSVTCELFDRTIKPKYPPQNQFNSKFDYEFVCRAITWETAHRDIAKQRNTGIHGPKYKISGTKYPVNEGKYKKHSYFRNDAPDEIKALEKNLNDRTDPLWDIAMQYTRQNKQYAFRILNVKRLRDC